MSDLQQAIDLETVDTLKKRYFSRYDGLRFFRLTPLGEYVLELTDRYQEKDTAPLKPRSPFNVRGALLSIIGQPRGNNVLSRSMPIRVRTLSGSCPAKKSWKPCRSAEAPMS